jgi:hypothetical protein
MKNDILCNADPDSFELLKEYKNTKEYIYRYNFIWKPNSLESYPIKENLIVNNVFKTDGGGYEFSVKETGEKYECQYNWAFAENTPENILAIEEFEEKNKELKILQNECNLLRDKIKTI